MVGTNHLVLLVLHSVSEIDEKHLISLARPWLLDVVIYIL